MRVFEVFYDVLITLYMLTWVVRFLVKRTNFFVSVLCLLTMSAGLASHRNGSTALFWAGFLLALFWTNGGGGWLRRRASSVSDALTDVARAAFRRDASASS
jgi:hypothetical protein